MDFPDGPGKVKVNKKVLGEGGFGFIHEGHAGKEHYAVKKLMIQSEEQAAAADREIDSLKAISSHPNVLPLLGVSSTKHKGDQETRYLLFPLLGPSLEQIIQGCDYSAGCPMPLDVVLILFANIVAGVAHIHSCGLRHGDLKPANVLFSENTMRPDMLLDPGAKDSAAAQVVVVDMGSCSPLYHAVETRREALLVMEEAASMTTASYRAPELFETPSHCVIDGSTDVWSLGCILFAMVNGHSPFEDPKEGLLSLAIQSANVRFPSSPDSATHVPALRELISSILILDAPQRPSAATLQQLAMDLATSPERLALPPQAPASASGSPVVTPHTSTAPVTADFADFSNFADFPAFDEPKSEPLETVSAGTPPFPPSEFEEKGRAKMSSEGQGEEQHALRDNDDEEKEEEGEGTEEPDEVTIAAGTNHDKSTHIREGAALQRRRRGLRTVLKDVHVVLTSDEVRVLKSADRTSKLHHRVDLNRLVEPPRRVDVPMNNSTVPAKANSGVGKTNTGVLSFGIQLQAITLYFDSEETRDAWLADMTR